MLLFPDVETYSRRVVHLGLLFWFVNVGWVVLGRFVDWYFRCVDVFSRVFQSTYPCQSGDKGASIMRFTDTASYVIWCTVSC